MLLADPLSRLCAPSDGFYDVTLPAKIHTLLENLPPQVAKCRAMRVSANKDRDSSKARMRRFIIRDTPKYTTFSIL